MNEMEITRTILNFLQNRTPSFRRLHFLIYLLFEAMKADQSAVEKNVWAFPIQMKVHLHIFYHTGCILT